MTSPLVSFCIPTFNRARYLDALLGSLTSLLDGFPYPYEVYVGDNASDDDTQEVLKKYQDWPPLRTVRHESNIGGGSNWLYLMRHAKGRYCVYVADDDCILGAEVANIIQFMEGAPSVGIAYAPWKFLDLVKDKELGQFYSMSQDMFVRQGDFAQLLEILLNHKIFPEIGIYRREVLMKVMPRVQEQAFYAFVHAAEFVQHSDVAFLKEPYYVSITNYFEGEVRQQAGHAEVEYAWDRYRGGLEHILSRAFSQISSEDRLKYTLRIQDMIAERMAVAVRMRLSNNRDPIETYYLASRLRALNAENLLPAKLNKLSLDAAIHFLATDKELNQGMQKMVICGAVDGVVVEILRNKSGIPVEQVTDPICLKDLSKDVLVLLLSAFSEDQVPANCEARVLHESTLFAKFPA